MTGKLSISSQTPRPQNLVMAQFIQDWLSSTEETDRVPKVSNVNVNEESIINSTFAVDSTAINPEDIRAQIEAEVREKIKAELSQAFERNYLQTT